MNYVKRLRKNAIFCLYFTYAKFVFFHLEIIFRLRNNNGPLNIQYSHNLKRLNEKLLQRLTAVNPFSHFTACLMPYEIPKALIVWREKCPIYRLISVACTICITTQWKFWDIKCQHVNNNFTHRETTRSSRTHCGVIN